MAATPYRAWGTAGRYKLSRPGKRSAARQRVQVACPGLMAQPALAEQAGETLEHQQSAVVVKAEGLGAQRVDAFV